MTRRENLAIPEYCVQCCVQSCTIVSCNASLNSTVLVSRKRDLSSQKHRFNRQPVKNMAAPRTYSKSEQKRHKKNTWLSNSRIIWGHPTSLFAKQDPSLHRRPRSSNQWQTIFLCRFSTVRTLTESTTVSPVLICTNSAQPSCFSAVHHRACHSNNKNPPVT